MADEWRLDRLNYRKHGEENKKLIRKSLSELGAGRSIVADADGELIAGNGVYEQAQKLGIPVKVVQTDGKELVVVQRTDLHTDDLKLRKLALADNATSDTSDWNEEQLHADWTVDELTDWGIDAGDTGKDDTYTDKIEGLTYEPTGELVDIGDLTDTGKYEELKREILASKLKKEIRDFLLMAAGRHIVFDYRKIAEYYAKAEPEVQRLMEKSALVIIDFDDAIQNGFVELQGKLNQQCAKDFAEAEKDAR